jgi:cell cycle sensor histidine kinase DivJ
VSASIVRFDEEGNTKFISNSAKLLFACQKYELSGSGLFERSHIMDRPLYLKSFDLAQMENKKQTITIRMRRDVSASSQGVAQYIDIEICFSPISKSALDAGPFEIVASFRDVSNLVSEKAKVEEIEQRSKASLEVKTQFLAMIGHELRTPLNAIVGFSDMMINKVGGEPLPTHMEYAQYISQSGYHLLDVVNDLLDMSKIESGKFEVDISQFEPASIAAPILQILSKIAKDKKVDIEIKLGKGLVHILADERAVKQIMINLLSNAVKFSHVGGAVVFSIKRQGNSIAFCVKDEGIGMEQAHVDRLGEVFLQAKGGHNRPAEGTGLGISIVKGLTDLHQGSFRVKSTINVGSEITVLLPIDGPVENSDGINENSLIGDIKQKNVQLIKSNQEQVENEFSSQENRRVG